MHGAPVSGDVLVHQSVIVVVEAVRELLVYELVAVVVDGVPRATAALVRHTHVVDGGVLLAGDEGVRLLKSQAVQHNSDAGGAVNVA